MCVPGRYRLRRSMSTRAGLVGVGQRPRDDAFDDLALGVGVVLDVDPVAGGQLALVARYRSRSSSCVRSRSRKASIRSISGEPALNVWRLTSVSGPLNTRCSCQSGSRIRTDVAAGLHGRDVRRLVGRVGDDQEDVDDRLGREARHGRRPDVLQQTDAVAEDVPDAGRLALVEHRPRRVVVGEVDRAVDPPPCRRPSPRSCTRPGYRARLALLEGVELRLGLEQVDAALDQVDDVLELPSPPRPVRR